jgi:chaperone modulatory protein CbpM
MTMTPITIPAELIELLDEAALSLHELARGCAMSTQWVHTHVEAGVLQPSSGGAAAEWRFAGATLVRARRIARLEHIYDADPQLAALTVDLMEEVAALRHAVQRMQG